MQYMRLDPGQRKALLASLTAMPEYLVHVFAGLDAEQARIPGPDGTFSPVEQAWHLADLERDGFGQRIRRLLAEPRPHLPDFDGARIAAERNYRSLSLAEGLSAFTRERQRNVALLTTLDADAWSRRGTQEGVGEVSLCDMPGFMAQHDAAHKSEVESWQQHAGR